MDGPFSLLAKDGLCNNIEYTAHGSTITAQRSILTS